MAHVNTTPPELIETLLMNFNRPFSNIYVKNAARISEKFNAPLYIFPATEGDIVQ